MYSLLDLLSEFGIGLMPVWIRRKFPPRYQIWIALGGALLLVPALLAGIVWLVVRDA